MKNLSVIVPFYNAERCIEDCINMLLKQTLDNYEVILINDGSTDQSLAICQRFINDDRIKLINKLNSGAWDTRNVGIENSNGNYIMFIDCDDRFSPEWLEKMYREITESKTDLVISGQYDWIVTSGKKDKYQKVIVKEEYFLNNQSFLSNVLKLREMHVGDVLWNKIYRADIIKENNIRFNNFRRSEDVDFNLQYYHYVNKCKVVEIYEYFYRVESNNPPWKKYGENYYKLVEDEYSFIRTRLNEWCLLDKESLQIQSKYLINGLIDYIRGLILYEKQSYKFILNYMNEVLNREYFQEALNSYNDQSILISLFVACLRNHNLYLSLGVIYIKIVGKWIKDKIRKLSIRDYINNRKVVKQIEEMLSNY